MHTMLQELRFGRNVLIHLFIGGIVVSCNLSNSDQPTDSTEHNAQALIPSELWVNDANSSINNLIQLRKAYDVYLQTNIQSQEMKLSYDSSNHILAITSKTPDKTEHIFKFERGLLEYSSHQNEAENQLFLAAYANATPYAAAAYDATWQSIPVDQLPLDLKWMKNLLKTASKQRFSNATGQNYHRIMRDASELEHILPKGIKMHYLCNLRKGDRLKVDLKSEYEDILFTVSTDKDFNMDYRSWEHLAPLSGDILITVFAPGALSEIAYTMAISITRNTQSPNSSEVLAVALEDPSAP